MFEQLIKVTNNPIGWLDIHRAIGGQNHIRWNRPLLSTSSLLSSLLWLALGIASHWPPLLLFLCRYNDIIVYISCSYALVVISCTQSRVHPTGLFSLRSLCATSANRNGLVLFVMYQLR